MGEIDEDLAAIVQRRVGCSVCGGRYSIEQVIGIGGMAAVYAGSHRNGRPVAMKFLHPEFSRRADIRKRFIREGQAANAVQHPSVVAVIDDDVAEDGSAFLVMERLEGKSLEQLWEELGRRLPTRAVLGIGRELCDVLAVAHRAGIYHRDLKPENLFLTNDGALKVLDFGLAHLRDAARPKDTHTGMVFGTPAFMPPEQASGQVSQIDARTDIWAVGATLFTLLSGELVHRGETAQHFVVLAAMEQARSLSGVLPHAHPTLVQIVDRALAREKESRWQSADAMREAICAAMDLLLGDHEAPLPTPIALLEMANRPKRRAEPASVPAMLTEEPTKPKIAAIGDDDTYDDKTQIDSNLHIGDSGSDTEPNAVKGGTSDTPTERTASDELPTQVKRTSDRIPVDPSKRASWSDLRRAIADHPSSRKIDSAPVEAVVDRTHILGRDYRPSPQVHSPARPPAPSVPQFAVPQNRASYPALLPLPRASRRTQKTRKPARWPAKVYLPVIGVSFLLGLTPLVYFLAGDHCGATRTEDTQQLASPVSAATTSAPSVASIGRPSVEAAAAPSASDKPESPPVPSARPSATTHVGLAAPLPSSRGSINCSPPFVMNADGIKYFKPECLPPDP